MFYEGFRITYSQTIWSVMAVRVFNNNALSLKAAASKVIPFDLDIFSCQQILLQGGTREYAWLERPAFNFEKRARKGALSWE